MSIRGWYTWLMRMRLAMVSRRRSSVGEGVGGMGVHCLVTVLPEWRCDVDLPMPSPDPELQRLRQNASALPLGSRIIRAVASSTAIETGQPVAEIERALTDRQTPQATPA
jgi:hypothetical protein